MASLKPGNEVEPPPARRVPITFVPQPSFRHLVEDGETWETVAAKFGMDVKELILANIKTLIPQEINWYLHHYVECNVPTTDGYNWRFSASARRSGNPRAGVIFIPMKTASSPSAAPGANNGLDQLAKDTAQMKQDLESIKKSLREGQAALRDLQCSLLFEAYKKYNTNRSLKYLSRDELTMLPEFIECWEVFSTRA
jgi:hypothetical protein